MTVLDLQVPADPAASATSVTAMARAAEACGEALRALSTAVAVTTEGDWSGEAADAFAQRCRELTARLAESGQACADGTRVLAGWADQAATARRRMIEAKSVAQPLFTAAQLAGNGFPDPQLAAAMQRFQAAWVAYSTAGQDAAAALATARDSIYDRSLGLGEQVSGFVGAVWSGAVADPVKTVWSLTGQAFTDREATAKAWQALPGQAADTVQGIAALISDPLPALPVLLDVEDWQRGRGGQALGSLAAMAVPGPKGGRLTEELARLSAAKRQLRLANQALDHANWVGQHFRPRFQSLDGLLTRVDLAANEGGWFGHTLARHVLVDDAYLVDRLRNGTLLPDGTRGKIPREASRFTDLATAQRVVDQILAENADQVRQFTHGGGNQMEIYRQYPGETLGTVCHLVNGQPVFETGSMVTLRLARTPDNTIYVATAMLSNLGPSGLVVE